MVTVQLTEHEIEALLEQIENRVTDAEDFVAMNCDEETDVDWNAELAFWRALEIKLFNATV